MVRRDGNLKAESWDVALDYVASRMRSVIREGKPVGVLGSARATNEENYLAGRLARVGLQTNHVDFSHHSLCRPLMAGVEDVTGEPFHAIRLSDIESSDTIVLVEGDLAKTHPRAAASVLKALERGARLIVIGCARTQMARLAARFVQTVPGSEGNAINGLLAAVLRADEQASRQAAIPYAGYDSLRRDLEAASMSDEIREAAGWIVTAERAVFLIGPSGSPADRLRGDAASLATLAAISGHLGRPGSGLLLLLGRSNVRGACDMGVVPDRLPGYECIDDAKARQRLQQLWGKPVPQGRGLGAQKMLESVSGLTVLADDPAAILPMGQRARAALERMEFLVVLDAYVTPAVTAAHAVLPIASFAETEGTVTNMEGRVQKVRAATVPPGEAMDGWKVLAELCARFGAGGGWSSATDVFREIAEAAPQYSRTVPQVLDAGWGSSLVEEPEWANFLASRASPTGALTSPERPYVLAWDGASDWGSDPLVSFSPTLSREFQSERKLFPNGLVEMSSEDADALGVRPGWRVKLSSAQGGAVVPIRLRKDLRRGVLLAPYGFRDWLADVLGEDGAAAVNVERA
jgi:predicted molibdopterin-dependent oxidoreductase YjgC